MLSSQPEGGFRRAAGRGAAVGPACPSSRTCPSSRRRRRRCASTPIGSARRTADRRPRSSRANGSTTATAPPSFAYLPLRTDTDVRAAGARRARTRNRFHAGMGTVYLMRLAELASVAIARFLPADLTDSRDAMRAAARRFRRNARARRAFALRLATAARAHARRVRCATSAQLLALAGATPLAQLSRAQLRALPRDAARPRAVGTQPRAHAFGVARVLPLPDRARPRR